MASQYARGRRAEWKTRDWLKSRFADGVVVRAAGSKGPVDLVLIGQKVLGLYQVKAGAKKPPLVPAVNGWNVNVVWWPPRASEPILLAPETTVQML